MFKMGTVHKYLKASKDIIGIGLSRAPCCANNSNSLRSYGSDNSQKHPEFINSTIMVEDGLNVRELPLVVRKVKNLDQDYSPVEPVVSTDSGKYHLIQAEFRQCTDLKDIFTLLSKCVKITPNIALAAMERICDLEKNINVPLVVDTHSINAHLAKGAILEKLLKVLMQTEDSQTIINALNVDSVVLEPYKHSFCDELLLRVIDNRLPLKQLVQFIIFLGENRKVSKYEETIDKLWVGFIEKQDEINEKNFVELLNIVGHLKSSKSIVTLHLEKKLWSFWWKLNVLDMQEILKIFNQENNLTLQSLGVVGRWLNTNIHKLDEDSLLDFITKITRLQYTDQQIENAVERYLKAKGDKVQSQVLIVSILNYCLTFKIRNKKILNSCSKYLISNCKSISHSFLKSFIYPFGYLYYNPENKKEFWSTVECVVEDKFSKLSCDDLLTILLSGLYLGNYPLKFVDLIFNPNFLAKISTSDNAKLMQQKINLIDSVMTLECKSYSSKILGSSDLQAAKIDIRLKKLLAEIESSVVSVAHGDYKVTSCVPLPNLCSNELYVVDFLLHPECSDAYNYNWITKLEKNKTIAIIIHLPEHYCLNSSQLTGPQMMRKRHLRLLGLRVVSLSYTLICKLQPNKLYLERYIKSSLENAEVFL